MTVAPGDLAADTQVTSDPAHAGRFRAEIPAAWQVIYAFGGVTTAIARRAAEVALDRDDLECVSCHALFCAPVPCGPVVVDTDVLRDGRGAAQVAADVRVPDGEGVALRLHATFGTAHRSDLELCDVTFPDVPPASACAEPPPRPPDDPFPPINFHDQTDWRPTVPFDPAADLPPGPARFAAWTRLHRPPRRPDGSMDLAALCVHGDALGPAVGRGVGTRREAPWLVLTLELGIRFVAPTTRSWILQDMRAWHAADGYAIGRAHLWDDERRLVGIATQTAHLRPLRPRTTGGGDT